MSVVVSGRGAVLLLFACGVGTASAHHSFGMFDMQKTLTIEGTVRDFQWTNPHVWIDVIVRDSLGKDVNWGVESDSINLLRNRGWSRSSLKAGDSVKLVIHPLKSGNVGGALVSASVHGEPIGRERAARSQ